MMCNLERGWGVLEVGGSKSVKMSLADDETTVELSLDALHTEVRVVNHLCGDMS